MTLQELALAGLVCLSAGAAGAQTTPAPAAEAAPAAGIAPAARIAPDAKPLPDIPTLMRQVEANERKSEAIEQQYLYHEKNQLQELSSHGDVKKTETRDFEVFWLNGVRVTRLLAKDGKDLSPDEARKENDRIDEKVKKARERREKADAEGKETDSAGHQEITLARVLELGEFSNPRREIVNGRPTILIDYQGDTKAKTRNAAESFFRELAGTVWVDEQDHTLQHLEGHVDNDFKMAGGLVMDVKKGTWFKATFVKINDEIWLPSEIEADGHARYLLFFSLNGHFLGRTSDYRKFKATSTLLPGATPVDDDTKPEPQ
jgi:hypothetical protein